MNTTIHRLKVRVRSPLQIGGWSMDDVADGRSATVSDGDRTEFFVTGSALRGAMRLALEQVLRGAGERGCEPRSGAGDVATCACRVCRLFGNVGTAGVVQVGPARLSSTVSDLAPELRHGVAIDRYTGSASDSRLFQQRVASPIGEPELVAVLSFTRAPTAEELGDLALAARLVESVGSGASRGLGSVSVELEAVDTPATKPVTTKRDAHGVVLCLLPETPFHVGSERNRSFYLPSLGHVPGGTLRGAVCTALAALGAESGPDADAFSHLTSDSGASFGDALPGREGMAPIAPRSQRECRSCGRRTSQPFLQSLAAIAAGASAPHDLFPEHGRCPKCGGRTRPVEPFDSLPRRLWTRVALDRHTRSAADQRLHTMELVDVWSGSEQLRLRAEVRVDHPGAAALVALLHDRIVTVGHGRGVGLGRMRVRVEPLPATPDSTRRSKGLQDAVAALRRGDATPPGWFTVCVLTGPWTRSCGADHPLADDPAARLIAAHPLRGTVSGFDLEVGRERQRRHAWLPGSVFAYQLPSPPSADWLTTRRQRGLSGNGPGAVRGEGRFDLDPETTWQEPQR